MAEKDFTKKLTTVVKRADKLIQDVQKDLGLLVAAGRELKDMFTSLKKPKDDDGKQDRV